MKFTRTVGCAVALLLLFGACKERPQTTQEQAVGCESLTFPIGEPLPTPPFTGEAYLQHLIASDSIFHFPQTNVVTFAPGAHSSWHRHGGMVVLVTDGVGLYQEEGKAAQVLRKGDVVQIPAGVRHWHGATKDNWFSQIVIYDAEWEPEGAYPEDEDNTVSDAYNEALVLQDEPTPTRGDELMFATADTLLTLPTFNGPIRLSTTLDYPNAAGAPALHYVVFEPGVFNAWHTHAGGQVLIVTDGVGYHQIEGQPVQILRPGDVALCPPGVRHWHGATAGSRFAHLAANANPDKPGVDWQERLSQEAYDQLPKE
ncbi:MAG: cupin domain-containing protein [Bacteroidales bacterium]|nr:cupin domain-containing protein [Bacteroidales bacterium]